MLSTNIASFFKSWYNINTGVPQGSIIRPLLFNIFKNNLFLSITKSNIFNFADYSTLYSRNKNLGHVFSSLKYDLRNVLNWFKINSMKANPAKFQLMILGVNSTTPFKLSISGKSKIAWNNS